MDIGDLKKRKKNTLRDEVKRLTTVMQDARTHGHTALYVAITREALQLAEETVNRNEELNSQMFNMGLEFGAMKEELSRLKDQEPEFGDGQAAGNSYPG